MPVAAPANEPLEGHERYSKVQSLNAGAFGFVQLAVDKYNNNNNVAVKFIPREKVNEYVQTEIINHRQLIHPHIIQFQEVFLTESHLAIAMEYANGGDMFEYVVKKGGIEEREARWFFQQLIIALDYCHRKGVVNRDIKLENTLIHWNRRPLLKICDFGYSKDEKYQSAPGSRVGTPAYLAPEVIKSRKGQTYNGKLSDVWSCGVMLYVMLVGAYPFERREDKKEPQNQKLTRMMERILNVDYEVPSRVAVSRSCKDLLQRILVLEPEARFTIPQIMQHPWFREELPDAALNMNEVFLERKPNEHAQTEEQIAAIISSSRQPASLPPNGQKQCDAWLDEMVNKEMDKGS